MIFSKEEIIFAYTVEKCPKCNKLNRRDFSEGDVLFTPASKCSFCDGIGPMVVGKMMLHEEKEIISFQTVLAKTTFEQRKLFLLKAEGPSSTVGRPDEALQKIIEDGKIDAIIMVDAALKMEGEDSASIARGFGAAIGGIGTEKFQIEAIATRNQIPVFSIIVKQSVKEAITLMSKEIADQADNVRSQVYDMILENTAEGQSVVIIGVGNTVGVPQ